MEHSTRRDEIVILAIASIVFLGCIASPPGLMDDVDAVQAQIARTMLESGDWVTARLNGVAYLEKSPLIYWLMAASMAIFGVHDWAARIPVAAITVALCWVTYRFARWSLGPDAAFGAGLVMSTSVGLFLFTRIQIPDSALTLTITLSLWECLKALQTRRRRHSYAFWAWVGVGLLLKGLIAAVFPIAIAALYCAVKRRNPLILRPFTGVLVMLAIAAPWHVIATLRNPPYLDFTFRSEPGKYLGFFWFYFMNEHVLRFLNLRHPRDYNTVPRWLFWAFHALWFFPWSLWLRRGAPSNARTLAWCWAGFVLIFFTFSTTQEYYSMPCYPAFALLLGLAVGTGRWPGRIAGAIAGVAGVICTALLIAVKDVAAPGDISVALTSNPEVYTLSLGHMTDLTIAAFAYLKLPLAVAAVALIGGAIGAWVLRGRAQLLALAAMMVIFFHAARLALVAFDPYLGSRALAAAIPNDGTLIVDDQYYSFSSVFFYTNRRALLLNGRVNNLEYGSYAPGAPKVFIDDSRLTGLWNSQERYYLVVSGPAVPRFQRLVGRDALRTIAQSGGKFVFSNQR